MISLLYFLVCMFSGSLLLAIVFNRKISNVLPMYLMFNILILYITGYIGFLNLGMYAIKIYSFFSLFISIYIGKKYYSVTIKDIMSKFADFGIVAYVCILFIAYYFLSGFNVLSWDEVSHWGYYTRAIFESNILLTKFNSDFNYPPASNLMGYYFLSYMNNFQSYWLFVAHGVFILSFPFFIINYLSKVNKILMILFSTSFYFLALYILSTDIILGIIFAYGCLIIFLTDKKFTPWEFINLFLAISLLILEKTSGIFFAFSLIAVFALNSFYKKIEFIKFNIKYIALFYFVLSFFIYYSWKIYYKVIMKSGGNFSNYLKINDYLFTWDRVIGFFKHFFYNILFIYPMNKVSIHVHHTSWSFFYSPGFYLLVFSVIFYFVYTKSKNANKNLLRYNYYIFLSISIFYTISLLGLYISAMGIEGENIYPSLGRYSSSLIYGIVYIALPILLIFNVIKPVIKIFLGIVFLVITFYNFQFLYAKKIRGQNYSYQLPHFIYSMDQGKSVCMNIRWGATNQIYNYGDYLSIRYYALMHNITIFKGGIGVCDYYFINSMDDLNNEKFSTMHNLKLGNLYKIIDKDKKIYEYITILEK